MPDGLATRLVDGYRAGVPALQRALDEFGRTATELGRAAAAPVWVWLAVELWDESLSFGGGPNRWIAQAAKLLVRLES